jgi:hypothetical protein
VKTAVEAAQTKSASGTVWLLQVVTPDATIPDARSREALANMLCSLDGIVSHSAVVHVGSGFRASLIRSIVTGLNALGRQRFPHKVFASTQAAVAWFGSNGFEDQTVALRKLSQFHQAAISGDLRTEQRKLAAGAR